MDVPLAHGVEVAVPYVTCNFSVRGEAIIKLFPCNHYIPHHLVREDVFEAPDACAPRQLDPEVVSFISNRVMVHDLTGGLIDKALESYVSARIGKRTPVRDVDQPAVCLIP